MRFGLLQLFERPGARTSARLLDEQLQTLIDAEPMGFDSVWVGEHHFGEYGTCASPALLLAALARETSRLRLGSAVTVLPFHHPVRVAEEFALLDLLSGGRVELGVGRGFLPHEFAGYGVNPSKSESLFEESLEIIRRLWTEKRTTFEGDHFNLHDVQLRPGPVQKPHPPLWMAAVRPASFTRAGSLGLGLLCSTFHNGTLEDLAVNVGLYDDALKQAGHDPSSRRVAFLTMLYVGGTSAEADSVLRDPARWQFEELHRYLPRDPAESYEHYAQLRERALWASWDDLRERCVAIAGDAAAVRERLLELRERIGLTDLLCWTRVGGLPGSFVAKSMRLLADDVIPVLRRDIDAAPASESRSP